VSSTIEIYNSISKEFRPTPAKSHYTYNLRDVSKVFQGLAKSHPRSIQNEDSMVKLWAHECLRVFQDRLISYEDREKFTGMVQLKMKEKFKKDWDKIVQVKPLLFASFTALIYPDGDETKKPWNDIYCELTDRDKVKKTAEESLADYNVMNRAKKMDLVLFTDAIEHIVKIHRIITTELGHALLVGVGGSGRKSLTELATFIANYTIEVLEMAKGYSFTDWREDMKNKLFFASGYEGLPYVFLFSDTQIINESFVEDINNILNNGEIPNIYNQEDYTNIIESVKEANKLNPDFKAISEDNNQVYNLFVKNARNNIHLCLAMSPIGDDFKRRLRMFPSLVNCCAIDWFLPWPQEALQSVATVFLSQVEDLPQIEGIISICVDMQTRVQELTNRYRDEMRRYYYVTPTSYLILIKTFTSLLDTKRNYIIGQIRKFERGLEQLAKAQKAVGELQETLSNLIPVLEVKAAESAVMQKDIEVKKKAVDKEKEDCAVEETGAKKEKESAEAIRKDCDEALAKVMPIYQQAMSAVNSLSSSDVTELRGFKTPPPAAVAVAKGLVLMFEVPKKSYKMVAAESGNGKVCDYWTTAKNTVLSSSLLKDLQSFKKDEMKPEVVQSVMPLLSEPDFQNEKLEKASKAAFGIGKWVRAIISYDDAMKIVTPKKIELATAVEMSAAAQKVWDAAKERLAAVLAEMKRLVDQLEATQAEETRLRNEKDNCERKVELAKALITGLADERENWKVDLAQRRIDRENLVGDMVISSGIIAYLGVFVKEYRDECTKNWAKMLMEFQI
jgi:dynein heavy chain, axonemal